MSIWKVLNEVDDAGDVCECVANTDHPIEKPVETRACAVEMEPDNVFVKNPSLSPSSSNFIKDVFLNDNWCLYFHDPNNEDWSKESYINIATVSTIQEYVQLENVLKQNFHKGMFFLMREHVFPLWDDDYNVDGGAFAIKVLKSVADEFWIDTCMKVLGEVISKDKQTNVIINGVSISPKKHFCIIKLWVANTDFTDASVFNLHEQKYGDIIFKAHGSSTV